MTLVIDLDRTDVVRMTAFGDDGVPNRIVFVETPRRRR
jgi:hypothetical protein